MVAKPKQCVSEEQIRKAQTVFAEMAKKSKLLTLQQALEKLHPLILPLFEQGYSYQDVVEVLHQLEIKISLTTLRQSFKEKAKKATAAKQEKPIPPPDVVAPNEAIKLGAVEIDVDAAIDEIATHDEDEPTPAKQRPLTEALTQQTASPATQTFTKRTTVAAIPVERVAQPNKSI